MGGLNAGAKECPICRSVIQPNTATTVCPSCGVTYHEECWKRNGGCTTFMCPGTVQQQAGGVGLAGSLNDGARPTGSCPKCGYVFTPMDKSCPRCAKNVQTGATQQRSYPPRPGQPVGARMPDGAFGQPKPYRQNLGFGMRLLAYVIDAVLLWVVWSVLNTAVFAGMFASEIQKDMSSAMNGSGATVNNPGVPGSSNGTPNVSPGGSNPTGMTGGPTTETRPNPLSDPRFMKLFKTIAGVGLKLTAIRLFIIFLYEVLMVGTLGATVGKLVVGGKVVKRDEDSIGFGAVLGRSFVKVLSIALCCIPFIVALFTENNRGVHDLLASTEVITTR